MFAQSCDKLTALLCDAGLNFVHRITSRQETYGYLPADATPCIIHQYVNILVACCHLFIQYVEV